MNCGSYFFLFNGYCMAHGHVAKGIGVFVNFFYKANGFLLSLMDCFEKYTNYDMYKTVLSSYKPLLLFFPHYRQVSSGDVLNRQVLWLISFHDHEF